MNANITYEKSAELLALTQQHGYEISHTQLVRWHRAGLLPRPRQLPLRTARGTDSLYPKGTGEQLLLLCSLRSHERRFSHLSWQLWLLGYPTPMHTIRTQLELAARWLAHWLRWFAELKQAMQKQSEPEELLNLIEAYAEKELPFRPLRRARKRTGRKHFPTFLRILLDLATKPDGESMSSGDEQERQLDMRILALGLGMEKRFVQKQDALEYYLTEALIPQLRWLFSKLQTTHWDALLEQTSDFVLLQTRDTLSTYLLRWETAKQYQDRLPDDYPRWQINLPELFRNLPLADQALVLLCFLAVHTSSDVPPRSLNNFRNFTSA